MDSQRKIFAVVLVLVILGVIAVFLQPKVEDTLAPEPLTAWVGIEVDGDGIARVGPQTLPAGTRFQLHAILEARDRQDRPVFYTQAKQLAFPWREVPDGSIRPWNRPIPARVRWFTVEGSKPFVEATDALPEIEWKNFLRAGWPLAWMIPGSLDTARDQSLAGDLHHRLPFGTQHFRVQVELYHDADSLLPSETYASWGAADLPAEAERFPAVTASLPGPAGAASRVFGLTQILAPPAAAASQLELLSKRGLAFSRATMLRDMLAASGRRFEDLEWRWTDLRGESRWGEDAAQGDLLRVGERLVVLYEDRGEAGILDYADLCFDFVDGAALRALAEVFSGEGEAVQLARVG